MTECVRGCLHRRRHVESCACFEVHNTEKLGHACCRGCLPKAATRGAFCDACHRRLDLILFDAPAVADWMQANLPRGSRSALRQDYERASSGDDAPIQIDLDLMEFGEIFHAHVNTWCARLCVDAGFTGPAEPWSVQDAAGFLRTHLSTLERQAWALQAWIDLADITAQAHALAPWRPQAKRVYGIPCPVCQANALIIFGGEDVVTCLDCNEIIPEDRYNLWTRMLVEGASA